MPLEVPFQAEGIEAYAIGRARGLEYQKDRNAIHRIFESTAKKARQMRSGKYPTIAQSGIESASIAASSANRVAAPGPDLDFVAPFFGADLGKGQYGR